MATLLAQFVGHVQQHQGRQAERNDASRQYQMAVQIGGIQNHDDGVRTWRAGHFSVQDIDRYLFVFRLGSQTIDAGQIDQRDFVAIGIAHISGMVFNGDTGKIADLLAQASEPIEKRGLTGIRRSNDSYGAIRRAQRFIPGPGNRMAAHCRGSHASVSKRWCSEQFNMDVAGQVAPHGNFGAFHAVNAGIATRTGACDRDFQAGHETQVHEVLGHRRGELHVAQDGTLSDA